MIILSFAEKNQEVKDWIEQLDELLVSYKLVTDSGLEHPKIEDGKKSFSGVASIQEFLKQLEKDVMAWRAPGCGK